MQSKQTYQKTQSHQTEIETCKPNRNWWERREKSRNRDGQEGRNGVPANTVRNRRGNPRVTAARERASDATAKRNPDRVCEREEVNAWERTDQICFHLLILFPFNSTYSVFLKKPIIIYKTNYFLIFLLNLVVTSVTTLFFIRKFICFILFSFFCYSLIILFFFNKKMLILNKYAHVV